MQLGAYVGDSWTIKPNLTLTMGLRLDVPIINDTPTANPKVEQIFNIKTDQAASGNLLVLPAPGLQLGRLQGQENPGTRRHRHLLGPHPLCLDLQPISNNSGMEFTRYNLTNPTFSFVPNTQNQPESGTGLVSGISEVDVIDKDFTYPQVLRTNLAVDHELPLGIIGTLEFLYSKTLNEILYQNLNARQTGAIGIGGRVMYARDYDVFTTGTKSFNDVIYLTNSTQGSQYSLSLQLQKSFDKNSWANFTYTYGQAKDVNSGTSSQAASNFGYNNIRYDINNPELTWSNYDVRHRIGAAFSYTFNFLKNAPTSLGLFYGGRSGRPYSSTYNSKGTDANGDGSYGNDLIYVPASISEVIMVTDLGVVLPDQAAAWSALNEYIEGDPALAAARGTIIERNASREPWYHSLDARLAQDIPVPGLKEHRLQITLDVLNLLNVFNKDWGKLQYVYNQNDTPILYKGIDAATGKQKTQFCHQKPLSLSATPLPAGRRSSACVIRSIKESSGPSTRT